MDFCDFGANLFLSLLATTLLFTSLRNSFWIGSYDFSKVGCVGIWIFSGWRRLRFMRCSCVHRSSRLLPEPVDYFAALRTVHPASPARCVRCCCCYFRTTCRNVRPKPERPVDRLIPVDYSYLTIDCLMFLPKANSSKRAIQSTTSSN